MQPVAILSALFCIVCNLSMFDCAIVGDHVVEAYSRIGRVMALYIVTIVYKYLCLGVVLNNLILFFCAFIVFASLGLFFLQRMASKCSVYGRTCTLFWQ